MPWSSGAASPHRDEQVGTTEYREFSTQPQRFPALSSAEIISIWRLSGNILLVEGFVDKNRRALTGQLKKQEVWAQKQRIMLVKKRKSYLNKRGRSREETFDSAS